MDLNEEERSKGKTVEIGRDYLVTEKKRFTILDCPGHKNYVQNMIQGAAQADVACLVVSARAGEFESGFEKNGQTREHAMLAKTLGARFLVVCINKMDTCEWSQDRYNYIKDNLQPFLVKNCGFETGSIFWCCVEGLTGVNIKEPVKGVDWYQGRTLFETLDQIPKIQRSTKHMIRIPILSKIDLMGQIELYGKIESGIVQPGMRCAILPT